MKFSMQHARQSPQAKSMAYVVPDATTLKASSGSDALTRRVAANQSKQQITMDVARVVCQPPEGPTGHHITSEVWMASCTHADMWCRFMRKDTAPTKTAILLQHQPWLVRLHATFWASSILQHMCCVITSNGTAQHNVIFGRQFLPDAECDARGWLDIRHHGFTVFHTSVMGESHDIQIEVDYRSCFVQYGIMRNA